MNIAPMATNRTLITVVLLGAIAFLVEASAFEADGFQSGMLEDRVRALLATKNLSLQSAQGSNTLFVSPNTGKSAQPSAVNFCEHKLDWYERSLTFGQDYVHEIASMLERHGQPTSTKVITAQMPSTGEYLSAVVTAWYFENDRVQLVLWPKGNDLNEHPSPVVQENFATKTSCLAKSW